MEAVRAKNGGDGPVGPKKQLGVYLPMADWLRLRNYAAERRVPITHLFQERLQPLLDELRTSDENRPAR
jgi:hypothetical protein